VIVDVHVNVIAHVIVDVNVDVDVIVDVDGAAAKKKRRLLGEPPFLGRTVRWAYWCQTLTTSFHPEQAFTPSPWWG
jgi:hypothetical protein